MALENVFGFWGKICLLLDQSFGKSSGNTGPVILTMAELQKESIAFYDSKAKRS